VIADLAKAILAHEVDAGWKCQTVPYSFVDAYAAAIDIKIPQAWANLTANDAGRQLLEEFFLLHQTAQLEDLAQELGVHLVPSVTTRAAIAKVLLSRDRLPLPKCIKPLAGSKGNAAKRKAKRGK
jgi:hypothetical protein